MKYHERKFDNGVPQTHGWSCLSTEIRKQPQIMLHQCAKICMHETLFLSGCLSVTGKTWYTGNKFTTFRAFEHLVKVSSSHSFKFVLDISQLETWFPTTEFSFWVLLKNRYLATQRYAKHDGCFQVEVYLLTAFLFESYCLCCYLQSSIASCLTQRQTWLIVR